VSGIGVASAFAKHPQRADARRSWLHCTMVALDENATFALYKTPVSERSGKAKITASSKQPATRKT
jgi:hypothetical protein